MRKIMRKKIGKITAVLVAVGLLVGVLSCTSGNISPPKLWESMTVYAGEGDYITEVEGNIMAVFYKTENGEVVYWCTKSQIIDRGDGTWDIYDSRGRVVVDGVKQDYASYSLYQYKEIEKVYDEEGFELPLYLNDLNLQPVTWSDLPQSMHAAALKSVAIVDGSPRAVVYRMFMGISYEVPNCRVTQSAYDNYMAGTIKPYNPAYHWNAPENKDCFVLVYFISETPYGTEVDIPVIVDKVIK